MKKVIPLIAALTLTAAAATASAQTTTPAPSTTPPAAKPSPAPAATPEVMPSPGDKAPTLTEAQAKSWVGKPIYSSDGKNLGEVANFQRDSSGKVTEMQADIGGFLGIGETRVKVMPGQFSLASDRVLLNMTAEQAKTLPKSAKAS